MNRIKSLSLAVALTLLPMLAAAQQKTNVKGHVNNEIGQPVPNLNVEFSTDNGKTAKYNVPTDANGDYTADVDPGTYSILVTDPKQPDKTKNMVDVFPSVKIGTEPVVQNFDMSRKEFMDKLSPERKAQIEQLKKEQASVLAANSQIKNLNATLTQARADIKAGNFQPAIDSMTQAVAAKPDEAILVVTLGDAQLGAKKYDDAITSYKKGIELATNAKKPQPEVIGSAYNNLAQAQAKSGKADDAIASYENATKVNPEKTQLYAMNEAIVLTQAGKNDQAAAAADRVIAADPTKADAYFLKGQALISKAAVDPKTQQITAPPECVAAYEKYLQLAPTGPHAEEVKQILAGIGVKVTGGYKAGKKG